MSAVTLSSKGQLVLPKSIRSQLQLEPGDKIDLRIEGGDRLVLRPIKKNLTDLKGFLPKPAKPLSLEDMQAVIAGSGKRL